MWMFTLCTGMSLLTYMTEVLVRKLANHFQSGSITSWHAYCRTIQNLFDHPKFANRRHRARITLNHTRSHQQMKVHIELDQLHDRLCDTVNIPQKLCRLDKWFTLEETANALLGDTHSLLWEWLYDAGTGAATDSRAARHAHNQHQDPPAGDKDTHNQPVASLDSSKPRRGRRVQAKLRPATPIVRQGSIWTYS